MKRSSVTAALLGVTLACGSPPPVSYQGPTPVPTQLRAQAPTSNSDDWRRQVPPPAQVPDSVYPATHMDQLDNGLSVLTVTWEAPTVSVGLTCKRSPDPIGQAGASALMTRLMTEGTRTKDSLAVAIAAESMGTTLSQQTSHDGLALRLTVLPEHAPSAVQLLAEVAQTPAFAPVDFVRAKKEHLNELVLLRQQPTQLAWLFGSRALLGPVHGRSISGTPAQVGDLKLADIERSYVANVAPQRCALLAAGAIEPGSMREMATREFSNWRSVEALPQAVSPPSESPSRNRVYWVAKPDAVQTSLWVGVQAPRYGEPGQLAREVLNNLFGGLFTSRINLNLREKHGYTYGAFSLALATQHSGAFVVSSSVRGETTAQALKEVLAEFKRLRSVPISAEELHRSQTDLSFNVLSNLEHTDSLLATAEEQFLYGLTPNRFVDKPRLLQGITASDLMAQAQRLPQSAYVIVAVGAPETLRDLGAGQLVDLSWLE